MKKTIIFCFIFLLSTSYCFGEAGDLELSAGLNVATDVNVADNIKIGLLNTSSFPAVNLYISEGDSPSGSVKELFRLERFGDDDAGQSGIGLSQTFYLENQSGAINRVGALIWTYPTVSGNPDPSQFALECHTGDGGLKNLLQQQDEWIGFLDTSSGFYMNIAPAVTGADRVLSVDMDGENRQINWTGGAAAGSHIEVEALTKLNQDLTTDANVTHNDLTLTGTLDLNNNTIIDVGYIDFETGAVAPAHSEGRIFYDDDEKTLSVYNNESDVTLQLGQEMYIRATNKTGSTILNGSLVYVDGAQGSRPTIALAKADAVATCQVLAMATHDIDDNATGFVTTNGLVHDVNTDGITAGDALYLSATTAGAYTDTLPTAPDFVIQIGRCIFENSTSGLIYIDIGPTAVCSTMVIQDLDINTNLDVAGFGSFDFIKIEDALVAGKFVSLILSGPVSADRSLNILIGDASRVITLTGNPTLDDWFDQSVKTTAAPGFASGVTIGNLTLADGSITDSGGTIDFDNENLITGGTVTLDTSNEINFRDSDISLGSTLSDGILDGSADTSIRMFFDNADVGNTTDGQSFYVYRRAAEEDGFLRFFTDEFRRSIIETSFSLLLQPGGTTKLEATSAGILVSDKLAFTQTDRNEFIDSLADGFMDYRATTAHRFGDGTNLLNIANTGDTHWIGSGTGLPYGHMYVDGTQSIIVALTLNEPNEVFDDGTTSADDGWLAGDLNLVTFPTGGTEHYLTVTKAGIYHVNWNLSFKMVTGAANTQIHAGLAVDGTAIRDKCEAHRTISNNTDTGNMAGSCMVDLPNGNEELSLWMENTTNSNDAEVVHGSLVAVQVGGT